MNAMNEPVTRKGAIELASRYLALAMIDDGNRDYDAARSTAAIGHGYAALAAVLPDEPPAPDAPDPNARRGLVETGQPARDGEPQCYCDDDSESCPCCNGHEDEPEHTAACDAAWEALSAAIKAMHEAPDEMLTACMASADAAEISYHALHESGACPGGER